MRPEVTSDPISSAAGTFAPQTYRILQRHRTRETKLFLNSPSTKKERTAGWWHQDMNLAAFKVLRKTWEQTEEEENNLELQRRHSGTLKMRYWISLFSLKKQQHNWCLAVLSDGFLHTSCDWFHTETWRAHFFLSISQIKSNGISIFDSNNLKLVLPSPQNSDHQRHVTDAGCPY